MRGLSGMSIAAMAGLALLATPFSYHEAPTPRPAPDPEPAKKARRVAAKMTKQRMKLRYGDDMPALDNHAAKLMGLPHQGSREMARRVKQMAKQEAKNNGRP